MYPHERSLVKKMEGRPFVLVGVNSDPDRDGLGEVMKKQGITWRSFWNGGSTGGPISRAWRVQGWPTLAVIDHRGVIRHLYEGSPGDRQLDAVIEELVKEAEGG
jgi:cytochrome oxidase Cu insertion factor (SCO1/SenC/PrrC family)